MERILQAFSEALRERGPGWWSRCWRAAAADDAGLARKKLESIAREFALPFDQNSIVKAGRAASKKQNLFFLLRRSALA